MKPVLLSHDSEVLLCSVPDEVAENLEAYCLRFACDWLWHSPEAKKYHRTLRGSLLLPDQANAGLRMSKGA